MIAALGVWASHAFGDPRIDGAASIAIGLILNFMPRVVRAWIETGRWYDRSTSK